MNSACFKFSVILFCVASFNSFAQTKSQVELMENNPQNCLDKGQDMLVCSQRYYLDIERVLNVVYKNLRNSLSQAQRSKLNASNLVGLKIRIYNSIIYGTTKMTIIQLRISLENLKVESYRYSLNGELKPDAIILFRNYNRWEVFYLDERGARNDEHVFSSEEAACEYIFKLFQDSQRVVTKYNLKT